MENSHCLSQEGEFYKKHKRKTERHYYEILLAEVPGFFPAWCFKSSENSSPQIRVCLYGGARPQVAEVTRLRWGNLSFKRDEIKMTDCKDRRVTPLKRVTSPTWGPPPPWKQAPTVYLCGIYLLKCPGRWIKFLDLESGRLFKVSTYSGLGENWTFTIFSKRNLIWQQNVKTFESH